MGMRAIEEIAREALQAAHPDLVKARRTLLPVVGVLALVHLLTVYPYLETARAITGIEASMASGDALLAQLAPEIEALQEASASAGTRLDELLDGVTAEMVESFANLRGLVARALQGEPLDAAPASDPLPMQLQQMTLQASPMQMPQANLPSMAIQAPLPPMQQMAPDAPLDPAAYPPPTSAAPSLAPPELRAILDKLAAGEPAWEELIAYARRDIVEAAYARAEREWSQRIRPAYLRTLAESTESARRLAGQAPESAAQIAAALNAAADEMIEQHAILEAIEISHDHEVEEALGSDWWHTVAGKGAYADAVADSVAGQMAAIMQTARAPSETIRTALALQEELRDALQRRQQELERQFAEQRAQLASLSGTAGVVPVDLASFIGLFPLVLGLVLAFMLWRAGQARYQGALAADDLRRAAPGEDETRLWLTRRLLGAGGVRAPVLTTVAIALGALAWIALAAWQIAGSLADPPLPPWTSATLAALAVTIAAGWDLAAIRRLALQLRA